MRKELVSAATERLLLHNGQLEVPQHGFVPVVKLFSGKLFMWLLTHSAPGDTDMMFGLCDTGITHPELGWISRRALEHARLPGLGGLRTDPLFTATHPVEVYAYAAKNHRRITENPEKLEEAATALKNGIPFADPCCHKHTVKTALPSKRHYERLSYSGWM